MRMSSKATGSSNALEGIVELTQRINGHAHKAQVAEGMLRLGDNPASEHEVNSPESAPRLLLPHALFALHRGAPAQATVRSLRPVVAEVGAALRNPSIFVW